MADSTGKGLWAPTRGYFSISGGGAAPGGAAKAAPAKASAPKAARAAAPKGGAAGAGARLWAPTRGYFQLGGGSVSAAEPAETAAEEVVAEASPAAIAQGKAATPAKARGAAPAPKATGAPAAKGQESKPAAKAPAAPKFDPARDSVATVPTLSESSLEEVIVGQLYDAPDSETTLYRIPALNFLFILSSAALLVFTCVVVWDDYARPWKTLQRDWQAELARRYEVDLAQTRQETAAELATFEPELEAMARKVAGPEQAASILSAANAAGGAGTLPRAEALTRGIERVLDTDSREEFVKYRELKRAASESLNIHTLKEKDFRAFKGDFQAAKFRHEEAKRHALDEQGETPAGTQEVERLNRKFQAEWVLKLESLSAEEERLRHARDDAAAALAAYKEATTFTEVAGPAGSEEVSLSRVELKLASAKRSVGLGQKKLETVESGWRKTVKNLPFLDFLAPSYVIDKVVLPQIPEDLNFQTVPRVDRCKTCHVNIDDPDPKFSAYELPDGKWGTVFQSHPRLDLFAAAASAHPYLKFGCTTCHWGDGQATDFVTAAHTPNSEEQREEWEKKYGWHPLHHQDFPMFERRFMTSTCRKCHEEEHALDGGGSFNLGYNVVRTYGCFGCHKIEAFKDEVKVGPSLENIGDKVDLSFLYRWIRNPTHFRPTTRMPRFFDLTNSSGKMSVLGRDGASIRTLDFDLRNGVESLALATYVLNTSGTQGELPPMSATGDPARGRELFKTVGCLGCHSVGRETQSTGVAAGVDPHAALEEASQALAALAAAPGAKPQLAGLVASARRGLEDLGRWLRTYRVADNVEGLYHDAVAALDAIVALDESLGEEGGAVAGAKGAARTVLERWTHNTFAPDLGTVGSKIKSAAWLRSWIIDPRKHDPKTTMPRLRLEQDLDGEEKVADIVAYLMSLKSPEFEARDVFTIDSTAAQEVLADITFDYKSRSDTRANAREAVKAMSTEEQLRFVGHRLVRRYGCYGCHLGITDVDGRPGTDPITGEVTQATFNNAQPIGTDLTGWGAKLPAFLDYGNWGHQHSGREAIGHTRYEWAEAKLSNTRRFDVLPAEKEVSKGKYVYEPTDVIIQKTPEELLKMPLFPFHDDPEIVDAVVTFLASLAKDPIPEETKHRLEPREKALEKGSRLISKLNCKGCHRIGAEPQFVNVSKLPKFSVYDATDEAARRNEVEKETWLNRPYGLQAANPTHDVVPNKSKATTFPKGMLLNLQATDPPRMNEDEDEPMSLAELIGGPVDADQRAKLPGHFAAFGIPETDRVVSVAGYEEGRMRFYFGPSADQRPLAPPPLVRQGERVRGDWLFRFLQEVYPVRLWLKVRMPSFYLTQDDARAIVEWFQANVDGAAKPNELFPEDKLDLALAQRGQQLFGPTVGEQVGLQCNSCHPRGDKLPTEPVLDPKDLFDYREFSARVPSDSYFVVWKSPQGAFELKSGFADAASARAWAGEQLPGLRFAVGDPWSKVTWGPDLGMAAERLRPAWIRQWVTNPPTFMPGTKMPNFFADPDPWRNGPKFKATAPGDDLTAERKIDAILQYLSHMKDLEGVAQSTPGGP